MKAALDPWIATAQMQLVQDYVSRGHHLEHSPEEARASDWIDLMRVRAAAPEKGQDPQRLDTEAEYSLRGVRPPDELEMPKMATLARGAAMLIEQMDAAAEEKIDSMILHQSSEEKKQANQDPHHTPASANAGGDEVTLSS
jgi:hypothetical protein